MNVADWAGVCLVLLVLGTVALCFFLRDSHEYHGVEHPGAMYDCPICGRGLRG